MKQRHVQGLITLPWIRVISCRPQQTVSAEFARRVRHSGFLYGVSKFLVSPHHNQTSRRWRLEVCLRFIFSSSGRQSSEETTFSRLALTLTWFTYYGFAPILTSIHGIFSNKCRRLPTLCGIFEAEDLAIYAALRMLESDCLSDPLS